jgi:prophage regulatory protein
MVSLPAVESETSWINQIFYPVIIGHYGFVLDSFTREKPIMVQLPSEGYLRLPQILGNPKANIPALIPISKSSWWAGIKAGRYPKGVKLGPRTTVWTVESIRALIKSTR